MMKGMIIGAYWAEKPNGKPDIKQIKKHIQLAQDQAIELWNEGFGVFTPHLNTRHFEIKADAPESKYKEFDLEMLECMDFIFVLPNWRKSKGAREETKKAILATIPMFNDIDKLKDWARKQK